MDTKKFRAFKRSTVSMVGLAIMISFFILALIAPIVCSPNVPNPYSLKKDMYHALTPPGTPSHLLGTDSQGSDVLYGIVWGARLSMSISLRVVIFSVIIGIIIGIISPLCGGVLDIIIMGLTDVFMAIPPYILAMAILASFGASVANLTVTLTVVFWPRFARMARSQVLVVKEQVYIDAARTIGMNNTRLVFKHILPNIIAPVFVQATLGIGSIVLWTAGLAFIGLVPPDLTEWGNMVSLGRMDMLGGYWWPSIFPGFMIFLFVLGVNLVSDGLRDILDPKRQGRKYS